MRLKLGEVFDLGLVSYEEEVDVGGGKKSDLGGACFWKRWRWWGGFAGWDAFRC